MKFCIPAAQEKDHRGRYDLDTDTVRRKTICATNISLH